MTLGTSAFLKELIGPFLPGCRFVIFHDISEIFDDAVETDEIVAGGMYQFLVDSDIFQGTIEYLGHSILRNLLDGCLDVISISLKQGVNLPEDHLVLVFA